MEDYNQRTYLELLKKQGMIKINELGNVEITDKARESDLSIKNTSTLQRFNNLLMNEPFLKKEGKAQIIEIKDTKEENKGKTLYEMLDIPENDEMKNYQVFEQLTKVTEEQQTKKVNKEGFHSIHSILKDAKYFEVPERINWLLCNTKNKVSEIRLPYIYMFFDTKFIIEDRTYYGLLLGDITQLREIVEKSKEPISHEDLSSLGNGIIIQTFYSGSDGVGWSKLRLHEKTSNRKMNKLKEYIMNLIYFINSEDVKLLVKVRSEKNTQRRIQNNKIPIPTRSKIQITGYLAKYLDKIESSGMTRGFNNRFTVRGHWRHFWNKRFDRLYQSYKEGKLKNTDKRQYVMDSNGNLKLWIYPFIKGEGILIENKYELT